MNALKILLKMVGLIMFDASADLKQLREFQNTIRRTIRNSYLTAAEKSVGLALVNWWWGRNKRSMSARGLGATCEPIHPGAAKLARAARVSVRSAKYALATLRAIGVIEVVGGHGGGSKSARLMVSFHHILMLDATPKADLRRHKTKPVAVCNFAHPQCAVFAHGLSINTGEEPIHGNVVVFQGPRTAANGGA